MSGRSSPGFQRVVLVAVIGAFALSACESGSSRPSPSAGPTTSASGDCTQSTSQARIGTSINPGPAASFLTDVFAYDCARHEAIKFGGQTAEMQPRYFDQTWAWRGGNWTELTTKHAPSPRALPVLGYDATDKQIVLFGGDDGHFTNQGHALYLNDTWAWDGQDWSKVTSLQAPAPPTRLLPAFAYFPLLKGMVLASDDGTWLYHSGSWARLADTPPAPFQSTMIYLPNLRKLLLFGQSPNPPNAWLFDGTRWSPDPVDDRPGPGYINFGMVYDSKGKQAVFVNGPVRASSSEPTHADLYTTNGTGWVAHAAVLPNADTVSAVGLIYAADLRVVVLFGADRTTGRIVTGWSWTGTSWQPFSS